MANVVDALRVYIVATHDGIAGNPIVPQQHNTWYHHEMCTLRASLLERRRALNDNDNDDLDSVT